MIWWLPSTSGIAGHRSKAPQGWLTPNDHTSPKSDLQFLRYLKKRMLIVELRHPHTRHVASSTVLTVLSKHHGKLIIKGHVTSTEAHDHKGRLWPGQHTG